MAEQSSDPRAELPDSAGETARQRWFDYLASERERSGWTFEEIAAELGLRSKATVHTHFNPKKRITTRELTVMELLLLLSRQSGYEDGLKALRRGNRGVVAGSAPVQHGLPLWRAALHEQLEEDARQRRTRVLPDGLEADVDVVDAEPPTPSGQRPPAAGPPRRIGRRLALLASVAVVASAVLLASTSRGPFSRSRTGAALSPPPTASASHNLIFNEYDLAVVPGFAYDLDIAPGQPPTLHATARDDTPNYHQLDLYRTAKHLDKVSGVDHNGDGQYNQIQLVGDNDPPAACLTLAAQVGGQVATSEMHVGTRMCVQTDQGRWVQLIVRHTPTRRDDPLIVHVVVLFKP